jgi:alpha-tubulin suppressor-like RCC1 family protein
MQAQRVLSVCAVTLGAAAPAGCGAGTSNPSHVTGHPSSAASVVTAPVRPPARDASLVYEWGQFGGGRPGDLADLRQQNGLRIDGSPFGVGPVRPMPTAVKGLHGRVVQIATSNSDDYALTSSGAVYAWGPGAQGELGNGTRERLSEDAVRVQFPAAVRIAKLPNPMPYNGGMAIGRGGTVWAWGNDRARDFCQARGSIVTTPIRVPLSHVTLAVGALRHTLYDTDGRIVSCGAGPNGQLGNGTSGPGADTGIPVAVRGLPLARAVALTSAWGNAGVLTADGRYYDWGYDAGGQVGDGTTRMATSAVRVALPHRVAHVFEGGSYADNGQTMAILTNGSLWEWGTGTFGQLGDHSTTDARRPVQLRSLHGVHFVAVNSGGSTDYAIDRRSQLWAWGNNRVDQLGDGSTRRMQQTPVMDPLTVSQISSTAHNVAALAAPPAA